MTQRLAHFHMAGDRLALAAIGLAEKKQEGWPDPTSLLLEISGKKNSLATDGNGGGLN